MASLILKTTTRYLLPLLVMFSVFLFARGHNESGGGFVAGLVAAAGFALYAIAYGSAESRRVLRVEPRLLIGLGLLAALASGAFGLAGGQPLLTGQWGYLNLPGLGKMHIGTPVLFDLGVYLAVWGATLTIVFALAEEE